MQSGISRRRAAALAGGGAAYAERRAEIIATAARIFREKGFRGASLADLAESLGTDRATLYYYIGSKEELFHEIVRDAAEANAQQAEAIRDGAGSAVDKLGTLITALMASYSTHYPYLFIHIQEDLSKAADGRSAWARQMTVINKRYDDAVIGIVESGFGDGSIRPVGPARVIAYGLIGMVNWTHRWYREGASGMPSAAEIGRTFTEMVLNGLSSGVLPTAREPGDQPQRHQAFLAPLDLQGQVLGAGPALLQAAAHDPEPGLAGAALTAGPFYWVNTYVYPDFPPESGKFCSPGLCVPRVLRYIHRQASSHEGGQCLTIGILRPKAGH